MASSGISVLISKVLSPAYYKQQYKNFLVNSYNYYHPMFRSGRWGVFGIVSKIDWNPPRRRSLFVVLLVFVRYDDVRWTHLNYSCSNSQCDSIMAHDDWCFSHHVHDQLLRPWLYVKLTASGCTGSAIPDLLVPWLLTLFLIPYSQTRLCNTVMKSRRRPWRNTTKSTVGPLIITKHVACYMCWISRGL